MTAAPPETSIDPLHLFQQSGVKIYLSGPDRVRLVGLDKLPGDQAGDVIDHARQYKPEIIARLNQSPAPCEVCPAAAPWSWGAYASKGLICFYAAWFLGRSASPAPCKSVRTACPLLTQKKGKAS